MVFNLNWWLTYLSIVPSTDWSIKKFLWSRCWLFRYVVPPPVVPVSKTKFPVIFFTTLNFAKKPWVKSVDNVRYNIFPAAENTNGVKVNGTWNGIIGALQRQVCNVQIESYIYLSWFRLFVLHQEADIGLAPVAISLQRYEALDFRGRIGGDWTSILVRYPPPYVSFTSTLDLFSKEVI